MTLTPEEEELLRMYADEELRRDPEDLRFQQIECWSCRQTVVIDLDNPDLPCTECGQRTTVPLAPAEQDRLVGGPTDL